MTSKCYIVKKIKFQKNLETEGVPLFRHKKLNVDSTFKKERKDKGVNEKLLIATKGRIIEGNDRADKQLKTVIAMKIAKWD